MIKCNPFLKNSTRRTDGSTDGPKYPLKKMRERRTTVQLTPVLHLRYDADEKEKESGVVEENVRNGDAPAETGGKTPLPTSSRRKLCRVFIGSTTTEPLALPFVHTAHSFACSALLSALAGFTKLILTPTPKLVERRFLSMI